MGWLDDRPELIWLALFALLIPLALVKRASPAAVLGLAAYAFAFAASWAWQYAPNPWADPATLEDTANRLGWWYDVHGVAKPAYLVVYVICLYAAHILPSLSFDLSAHLVWGTVIASEVFAFWFENVRCNLLHHVPHWIKIAGWGDRDPDTCVALFGPLAVVLPAALYWLFFVIILLSLPWRTSQPSPPSGS